MVRSKCGYTVCEGRRVVMGDSTGGHYVVQEDMHLVLHIAHTILLAGQ